MILQAKNKRANKKERAKNIKSTPNYMYKQGTLMNIYWITHNNGWTTKKGCRWTFGLWFPVARVGWLQIVRALSQRVARPFSTVRALLWARKPFLDLSCKGHALLSVCKAGSKQLKPCSFLVFYVLLKCNEGALRFVVFVIRVIPLVCKQHVLIGKEIKCIAKDGGKYKIKAFTD